MTMLALSLLLNCLIVFPVSVGMFADQPGMTAAFGANSDARRILASVYLAIGLLSGLGLLALALGLGSTVRDTAIGLLAMQVAYKMITVLTVGLHSPVVITNIVVIIVHTATLMSFLRS